MAKDVFSVSVLALGGAINSIDTTPLTALYQAMFSARQALQGLQRLLIQGVLSNPNHFAVSRMHRAVDEWFWVFEGLQASFFAEKKEDTKRCLLVTHILLLQLDVLLVESLGQYAQNTQRTVTRSEVVTAAALVSVLLEGTTLVYRLVAARRTYHRDPSKAVLTEMRTAELTLGSYKHKLMMSYRQYSLSRCW